MSVLEVMQNRGELTLSQEGRRELMAGVSYGEEVENVNVPAGKEGSR